MLKSKVISPPQPLLAARRALEGMQGVTLLRDWIWYEEAGKWALYCRLSPDIGPDGIIPPSSDWFVLVDPVYPWGSIKFYPSKQNGINQTFPHQNYNGEGSAKVPWRSGDLCLNTSIRILGRMAYDIEPFGIHHRLRWHFQRALEWLIAASQEMLFIPGEPFELPQTPNLTSLVGVCEGAETFSIWENVKDHAGLVEFSYLGSDSVLFVKRFLSVSKKEILSPNWGRILKNISPSPLLGIWLRLNTLPILRPWQSPSCWSEMREAFKHQGVDLDSLLNTMARFLRDGKSHLLLIGAPIPFNVGDSPCQIHWQALKLPVLTHSKNIKGFRPNGSGYRYLDRNQVLKGNTSLNWVDAENWHQDQITTRGRLPTMLTSKKILLIGTGAVGSVVAELLVRSGVTNIILMDYEKLSVGNLVRHTLEIKDIERYKATAVANHLNLISPYATVDAINSKFPTVEDGQKSKLQECDIIIDCTASDEVLQHLESFQWNGEKLFFSISLGFKARRLFCFVAHGNSFPFDICREKFNGWLLKERGEYSDQEFPREGIGCWHPVFPARADDIFLMTPIAIKFIESSIAILPAQPDLLVFEQSYENGDFAGIRRLFSEKIYA